MRLGFIFGFLIGALVASVKGETSVAEAPGLTAAVITEEAAEPEGFIEKLKAQTQLAVKAAKIEADRREAEMLREFEAAKQNHPA